MYLFRKRRNLKKQAEECLKTEPQEQLSKYEIAKREAVSLAKGRYDEVMSIARFWLNGSHGQTKEEKIDILNYLIEILLVELCSCGAVDPLINSGSELYQNGYRPPFPIEFKEQNGKWVKIYGEETVEVDLAEAKIYVHPWNNKRTAQLLSDLKGREFVYDKNNHISYYFPDLDFCYVYNGNHSINMGRYMKKGKIIAKVCDMEKLYTRIWTDGIHWYDMDNDGTIRSDVDDYRLAAAFTFGQRRWAIRNGYNYIET